MSEEQHSELSPWERLTDLVETSSPTRVEEFLESLKWSERALAISRLSPETQEKLLMMLEPEDAAELVDILPSSQAADIMERLDPEDAGEILEELPSDQQVDILLEIEKPEAERILAEMDPEQAQEARQLLTYEPDSAGGLMATEFLSFPDSALIGTVLETVRARAKEYAELSVQYLYLVSAQGTPVGVLGIRELLMSALHTPVRNIMQPELITVSVSTGLEELDDLFERYPYFGFPVLDEKGVMVGIVTRSAVEQALTEKSESAFLSSQGIVGGEEIRSQPLGERVKRRLSWLLVSICLNFCGASVIASNEETLSKVIALAIFLPILSDMSGASGNQAVAVTIRELSLGLVRTSELMLVWLKEVGVGVVNGLTLGTLLALVAWLWHGNPWLGVAVGGALSINIIVAVSLGGIIPLILRRLGKDPAVASGLILTTTTDMCGFFLALTFASWLMPYLT